MYMVSTFSELNTVLLHIRATASHLQVYSQPHYIYADLQGSKHDTSKFTSTIRTEFFKIQKWITSQTGKQTAVSILNSQLN